MTQATWTMLISCGLLLAASSAAAQDIIRFDDQAGGAGSPTYPGAPAAAASSEEAAPAVNGTPSKNSADDGGYSDTTVFQRPQGGATSAQTDELLKKEPKEIYSGIIPGKRDEVKHIDTKQGPGEIKWIGFLAEKTRTRVFIQTNGAANYETSRQDNKLVLTFSNSSLAAKNFSRHIDTSFYGRSVKMIQTKNQKRKKVVEITLTLNNADEPRIDKQGEYIYVDFKHSSANKEESNKAQ